MPTHIGRKSLSGESLADWQPNNSGGLRILSFRTCSRAGDISACRLMPRLSVRRTLHHEAAPSAPARSMHCFVLNLSLFRSARTHRTSREADLTKQHQQTRRPTFLLQSREHRSSPRLGKLAQQAVCFGNGGISTHQTWKQEKMA